MQDDAGEQVEARAERGGERVEGEVDALVVGGDAEIRAERLELSGDTEGILYRLSLFGGFIEQIRDQRAEPGFAHRVDLAPQVHVQPHRHQR